MHRTDCDIPISHINYSVFKWENKRPGAIATEATIDKKSLAINYCQAFRFPPLTSSSSLLQRQSDGNYHLTISTDDHVVEMMASSTGYPFPVA